MKKARRKVKRRVRRAGNPFGAAVSGPVRFAKVGGSYMITVPRAWVEAHGLDPRKFPELYAEADEKLMVVYNPKIVEKRTERVHKTIDRESKRLKKRLRKI